MLEKLRSIPGKIGVVASICFACAFCGFPAAAGSSTAGLISFVFATAAGSTQVVFFNQSGARSAMPSCATYTLARWVLDVSTPAGQAAMSIIMTALRMVTKLLSMAQAIARCGAIPKPYSMLFISKARYCGKSVVKNTTSKTRHIAYFVLLLGALLALTGPSHASITTGNITGITVTNWGQVDIFESSGHPARPACATTPQWDFNVSTAAGQAILSTLLTAYSLGKSVTITGTGTCDIESNVESIFFIFIQK